MSNADLELAKCVVRKVADGAPYSRETIASCYYEQLKDTHSQEVREVSEKWIDYIWNRLEQVHFNRIASSASSDERLAKVLYEALGK
ncbi:hypothetical protein ABIE59_004010 [Marinobacter sp. MBR-99]|jgi:hypothetical protein|uniref:hypothetical protein n=1 Tax=Marinobacter sp. MBR-99 TaxID=3156461 RepID=UPI00339403E1